MRPNWTIKRTSPTPRERIEMMPYGCSEQMEAADKWFRRFMKLWLESGPYTETGRCYWLIKALERSYTLLHNNDIWYQARRRWNYDRAEEQRS